MNLNQLKQTCDKYWLMTHIPKDGRLKLELSSVELSKNLKVAVTEVSSSNVNDNLRGVARHQLVESILLRYSLNPYCSEIVFGKVLQDPCLN